MKKLAVICLIVGSCLPALAQKEIKAIETAVRINTELSRTISQQLSKAEQSAAVLANTVQTLIPLQITEASPSLQTKMAVLLESMQGREIATGKLLRSTYMRYQEADLVLNDYLERINQAENTSFLYRGMHVNDLQDVQQILAQGMLVNQTGYNSIYMSANFAVARHYAKLEEGIPVVVMIKKDDIAGSLRPGNLPNFYAEKDIPPQAIFGVFVLLDINGTPGWYRVLWQNKLIFTPLTNDTVKPAAKSQAYIQITNMPGEPTVKLGGAVDNAPAVLSARVLPSVDRWDIISPTDPVGAYTGQIFLPKDILENKESFYRGMRLEKLDDVKNLLINGLEAHRTNYHGDIYASLMPSIALGHAIMAGENLSVLVQIPATDKLRSYAPEAFPTDDRYAAKAFQTGEVCIFRRDVPASFISNIWVFLEVNGTPGWYKATLENGELIFTPVPAAYLKKKN